MLWLQDTNRDQTAISGAFEVAITETQGSFDQLSFKFVVDPTDVQDPNYVVATMILPRTIVVEPVTGKKFRILQPQPESLGDKLLYTVTCTSIAYDLHDTYIEAKLENTQSLTACLDLITSGTSFKYHITGSFANYSFSEDFGGDFSDTLLSNLASDFKFEYYFDNYDIYIASSIGKSGTFLFVENANAEKFVRQEDYSTITTYIKGYGKQNDDGSYTTTADYTSSLASNWGKIWASPYSSDSITVQATLLASLKSQIHDYPDVQYTMSYTDFINNVQGFENDTTPGNYGWLRNRFGVDVSVRVQSRTWYPQEQDSGQTGSITFGNKIFDPNYFFNQLRNGYQKNYKLSAGLQKGLASVEEYTKSLSTLMDNNSTSISDLQNEVNKLNSNGIIVIIDDDNTDDTSEWFANIYDYGAKSAVINLTTGTDTTNALASTQITNLSATSLKLVGCSHKFMGNGTDEAQAFLNQLETNDISKTTIVVAEITDSSLFGMSKDSLTTQLQQFYSVLINAGYVNTCDYACLESFGSLFDASGKYKWVINTDSVSKPLNIDAWEYYEDWYKLNVRASYAYTPAFV